MTVMNGGTVLGIPVTDAAEVAPRGRGETRLSADVGKAGLVPQSAPSPYAASRSPLPFSSASTPGIRPRKAV
jgi:hypothetical protein